MLYFKIETNTIFPFLAYVRFYSRSLTVSVGAFTLLLDLIWALAVRRGEVWQISVHGRAERRRTLARDERSSADRSGYSQLVIDSTEGGSDSQAGFQA